MDKKTKNVPGNTVPTIGMAPYWTIHCTRGLIPVLHIWPYYSYYGHIWPYLFWRWGSWGSSTSSIGWLSVGSLLFICLPLLGSYFNRLCWSPIHRWIHHTDTGTRVHVPLLVFTGTGIAIHGNIMLQYHGTRGRTRVPVLEYVLEYRYPLASRYVHIYMYIFLPRPFYACMDCHAIVASMDSMGVPMPTPMDHGPMLFNTCIAIPVSTRVPIMGPCMGMYTSCTTHGIDNMLSIPIPGVHSGMYSIVLQIPIIMCTRIAHRVAWCLLSRYSMVV